MYPHRLAYIGVQSRDTNRYIVSASETCKELPKLRPFRTSNSMHSVWLAQSWLVRRYRSPATGRYRFSFQALVKFIVVSSISSHVPRAAIYLVNLKDSPSFPCLSAISNVSASGVQFLYLLLALKVDTTTALKRCSYERQADSFFKTAFPRNVDKVIFLKSFNVDSAN